MHTHYLYNNAIPFISILNCCIGNVKGSSRVAWRGVHTRTQATTCNTPTHGVFKGLAYAVILAFSFGMPLCAPGLGRHRSPLPPHAFCLF